MSLELPTLLDESLSLVNLADEDDLESSTSSLMKSKSMPKMVSTLPVVTAKCRYGSHRSKQDAVPSRNFLKKYQMSPFIDRVWQELFSLPALIAIFYLMQGIVMPDVLSNSRDLTVATIGQNCKQLNFLFRAAREKIVISHKLRKNYVIRTITHVGKEILEKSVEYDFLNELYNTSVLPILRAHFAYIDFHLQFWNDLYNSKMKKIKLDPAHDRRINKLLKTVFAKFKASIQISSVFRHVSTANRKSWEHRYSNNSGFSRFFASFNETIVTRQQLAQKFVDIFSDELVNQIRVIPSQKLTLNADTSRAYGLYRSNVKNYVAETLKKAKTVFQENLERIYSSDVEVDVCRAVRNRYLRYNDVFNRNEKLKRFFESSNKNAQNRTKIVNDEEIKAGKDPTVENVQKIKDSLRYSLLTWSDVTWSKAAQGLVFLFYATVGRACFSYMRDMRILRAVHSAKPLDFWRSLSYLTSQIFDLADAEKDGVTHDLGASAGGGEEREVPDFMFGNVRWIVIRVVRITLNQNVPLFFFFAVANYYSTSSLIKTDENLSELPDALQEVKSISTSLIQKQIQTIETLRAAYNVDQLVPRAQSDYVCFEKKIYRNETYRRVTKFEDLQHKSYVEQDMLKSLKNVFSTRFDFYNKVFENLFPKEIYEYERITAYLEHNQHLAKVLKSSLELFSPFSENSSKALLIIAFLPICVTFSGFVSLIFLTPKSEKKKVVCKLITKFKKCIKIA